MTRITYADATARSLEAARAELASAVHAEALATRNQFAHEATRLRVRLGGSVVVNKIGMLGIGNARLPGGGHAGRHGRRVGGREGGARGHHNAVGVLCVTVSCRSSVRSGGPRTWLGYANWRRRHTQVCARSRGAGHAWEEHGVSPAELYRRARGGGGSTRLSVEHEELGRELAHVRAV